MFKIVTFNLRCTWMSGDGANAFIHRAGMITEKIDAEKPDVVCFQEAVPQSYAYLERHLPDYAVQYNGRQENYDGEGLVIAYRRDRIRLVTLDCFWLSPTPDVPASRFEEQSCCPRILQDALLMDKQTEKLFRVYNNHLDHVSEKARELGMTAVLKTVAADQKHVKCPVFLLGDLNAVPTERCIKLAKQNRWFSLTDLTGDTGDTFHAFMTHSEPMCKIDYIFTDPETATLPYQCEMWTDERNGIYLSDHYPVCVCIENN